MQNRQRKYNGTFFSYLFGNRPQIDKEHQFKAELFKSIFFIVISALIYSIALYLFMMISTVFNFNKDLVNVFLNQSSITGVVFSASLMTICYYITYYLTFRQTSKIIKQYDTTEENKVPIKTKILVSCVIGFGFAMFGNIISSLVCLITEYISRFFSKETQEALISSTNGGAVDYSPFQESYFFMVILFVLTVILPPIVEELIFRKNMYEHLSVFNERTAILLTTVLFALFHGNVQQIPFAFFAGLGFLIIKKYTGKLRYCIITHIIVNLLAFVVQYLSCKYTTVILISNIFIVISSIVAITLFIFNDEIRRNIFKSTILRKEVIA